MPYMGRSNTGFGIRDRFQFTAAGSETSISGSDNHGRTLKYSDGKYVDVYLNGVYLDSSTDYNTTTANTIGGLTALTANDFIDIVSYDIFSVADVVPATGGTFSGNVTAASDFAVEGNLTVTGTIVGDVEISGTTPKLTIGDAGAEDSSLVFDGNAQDYYIALDDSADDLVIGLGSAVGTTPAISIDENQLVTTHAGITMAGTTPTLTIGDAGAEDTKIVFDGNAKDFYIALDDSADKMVIGEGSTVGTNSILTITDDSVTIGDAAAVDTKLVFDGNAQDFYVGLDDSADDLLIGVGSAVGTTPAIAVDENAIVNFPNTPTVATAAVKFAGKESMFIPAAAMYPSTTNPCADLAQVETTALRPDLKCLDFDNSSDEFAQFAVAFPKSWNEGTISFQPFWTVTGTNTGTVAWQLGAVAVSSDDSINTAFGTLVATTALAHSGTSNDLMVSVESGAVTIAGSPAAADQVFFQINRDVSADAQSGDARLLGVKLFFTTDAGNDA
jgi:hypothetical protein